MKNTLPRSRDDLFALSEKAADGLHALEAGIGIMHNTEAVVRADLVAARTANNLYQAAKAARLAATDAQEAADANATAFITAARERLKGLLGSTYSQAWAETGFTNNTLAIPTTLSRRMELLKSLELYFTAHAAHEVAGYVTHTQAATLHDALSTAISATNTAHSVQRSCRDTMEATEEALRKRLRGLIGELTQLILPISEDWLAFGFHIPADNRTPDVPADLEVTGGAAGHLVADWANSARADRYRVYKQVVGVDDDFVLAKTVTDSDADLNTFTPGAQVRVRVTAVNNIGESLASEVVEHVVP